jgi:endonuclease/exonuclease/phosphatase family metal-dependent hydrolase
MKAIKRVGRWILYIALLCGLYVGGMIAYAWATDYIPEPQESSTIKDAGTPLMTIAKDTFSLFNWNIGFAGLGEESDFFYDGGKQVRMERSIVEKNLAGIKQVLARYRPETDFFLLQEVDESSRRSHRINELKAFEEILDGYSYAFGKNYDVNFVPVPFTNPLGGVLSGITTYSRYKPAAATRYAFEGNYDFPNYLFFLDRCFLLTRFPLPNGQDLVVINTHNSAYDDGGLRKAQMQQMTEILLAEYKKGNYVIVGGDWNQRAPGFPGFNGKAKPAMEVPAVYPAEGWQWAFDASTPSNRALQAPYDADTTTRALIDFYLLSPNVEVLRVEGVDIGFAYSDHQPVRLWVRLKGLVEPAEPEGI